MRRFLYSSFRARTALLIFNCALLMPPVYADVLNGAGATFPAPLYLSWAARYREAKGIEIDYQAVGSGSGISRIEGGLVDFGASDIPLTPAQLGSADLIQFPAVIGGVVPIVNIDGIGSGGLHLSGSVLAEIYLGHIRKWNASAIQKLNPGLHLPSANITVVHRADASGSTFLWSRFLALSNSGWSEPAAATITWPVGVAAIGNEGVASMVQRTRMSIGYAEYAYAEKHRLRVGALLNHDHEFVAPNANSFRAAMEASWRPGVNLDALLIDAPGKASWPITAASFVLLKSTPDRLERNRTILKFFDWALTQGQQTARDLDYVPLPDEVVVQARQSWPEALQVKPSFAH